MAYGKIDPLIADAMAKEAARRLDDMAEIRATLVEIRRLINGLGDRVSRLENRGHPPLNG